MSDSGRTLSDPPWTWSAERKALDEAQRRIAVLEAALRPFGTLAGFLSEHWSDHAGLGVNGALTDLGRDSPATVGHARRAAGVLACWCCGGEGGDEHGPCLKCGGKVPVAYQPVTLTEADVRALKDSGAMRAPRRMDDGE